MTFVVVVLFLLNFRLCESGVSRRVKMRRNQKGFSSGGRESLLLLEKT